MRRLIIAGVLVGISLSVANRAAADRLIVTSGRVQQLVSIDELKEDTSISGIAATGTWKRPPNVTSLVVRACGGGGGGGGAGGARNEVADNGGGGGGGAGSPLLTVKIDNLNASEYYIRVGGGGVAGGGGSGEGGDGGLGGNGGDTVFGPSVDRIAGTNIPVDPREFVFPGAPGGAAGRGARGVVGRRLVPGEDGPTFEDILVDGRGGAGGGGANFVSG